VGQRQNSQSILPFKKNIPNQASSQLEMQVRALFLYLIVVLTIQSKATLPLQQYQCAHRATDIHTPNAAHVTCYSRFSLKILW
jgi:hypothetical protein